MADPDPGLARPRFMQRLLVAVRRDGLVLLLVAALVSLAGASFDAAAWVPGVTVLPGMFFALLLGVLLARSRFRGPSAAAYLALVLTVVAVNQVGHVLPVGPDLGLRAWVWTLHLGTLTWLSRAAGWLAALAAGHTVRDTGLFIFLFSLLAWSASAWLAWSRLRRQAGLPAVLPLGALLAVNLTLAGLPWQTLWAYAMLTVPLLLGAALSRQQAGWARRGLDHPGELWFDWLRPALLLSIMVGLLASAAPVAATRQGWAALSDLFAAPRQQAAETAGQLFSGVNPPRGQAPRRAVTPDLGRIGAPLDQGHDTVMWVWVSDPPPPPPAAGRPSTPVARHYWRSGLFAVYTGPGWQPLDVPLSEPARRDQSLPPPGRYALRQEYELVAAHDEASFAVSLPVTATGAVRVVAVPPDSATALLRGSAARYEVVSWATRVSAGELRAAPAAYPSALAAYLQLPAALPPRVRALAGAVVAGAQDNYERAARVQSYLRSGYLYDLDVPLPPPGRDAVDYFLFEQRAGFCSHFASAMAVLLRAAGVPARVATGYAMGEFDFDRGAYRVPGAAAHAWVEVYFPGYGWVEFEPTPAQPAVNYAAGAATASLATPQAAPLVARPLGWTARIRTWAGIVLSVAAGLSVWALAVRRRRRFSLGAGARALRLYVRLRRSLARAGLVAPPSATPLEFAARHAATLAGRPALRASLLRATYLHERAAYSRHAVPESELAEAERLWRAARRARLALLLRRVLRR